MNAAVSHARCAPRFAAAIAFAVIATATVALWPAPTTLAVNWRDMVSYDHGPLIALISAYWLWRARDGFARERWTPSPPAAFAFAVALLAWLVAFRAHSNLGVQLLWPPILYLALATVGGRAVASHVRLPVAFLYFGIPVWDLLLPALQALTSLAAGTLLGAIGVPVLLEGNHVTIPAGAFVVVEDCAGKRFLVVALAAATLLAVERGLEARRFALALLAGAVLAIVWNWIRVLVVIVAGHLTDMQSYLVAKEHKTFGYVVFAALLLSLYAVVQRIARGGDEAARRVASAEATPGASSTDEPVVAPIAAAAGVATMLTVVGVATVISGGSTADAKPCLAAWPDQRGEWRAVAATDRLWRPRYEGAAASMQGAYAGPTGTIGIYANLYSVQREGSELISFRNSDTGEGRWEWLAPPASAALDADAEAPAVRVAAGPGGLRYVIATRYRVGRVLTSRPAVAQAAYGIQSLIGPVESGVLSIAARCDGDGDCNGAGAAVAGFWRAAGPALRRYPASTDARTAAPCPSDPAFPRAP
jgi:EpsI family protein